MAGLASPIASKLAERIASTLGQGGGVFSGFILTFDDPDGTEYILTFDDPNTIEYILTTEAA